jgi:hypothetical protein
MMDASRADATMAGRNAKRTERSIDTSRNHLTVSLGRSGAVFYSTPVTLNRFAAAKNSHKKSPPALRQAGIFVSRGGLYLMTMSVNG